MAAMGGRRTKHGRRSSSSAKVKPASDPADGDEGWTADEAWTADEGWTAELQLRHDEAEASSSTQLAPHFFPVSPDSDSVHLFRSEGR